MAETSQPLLGFVYGENLQESTTTNFSPGKFYLDIANNELWYDNPSQTNGTHTRLFDNIFTDIYNKIDDLNYEQITIKSFAKSQPTNTTVFAKGSTLPLNSDGTLSFTWSTSKIPEQLTVKQGSTVLLTVEKESLTAASGTVTVTPSPSAITANTTFTLLAEDARTIDDTNYPDLAAATKTNTITFYPTIFYGVITKGTTMTSDKLLNTDTINTVLKSNKSGSYTVDTGSESDNLVSLLAFPASYLGSTPKFSVGGLEVSFSDIQTISVVNGSHTENYTVYLGSTIGLGSHTIVVS